MVHFTTKTMQKLAVCLAFAGAPVLSAHAQFRCDSPGTALDVRVCALGEQGPAELRRFIERTRMIYALSFRDYRRPEATAASARADFGPPSTVVTLVPAGRGAPGR